MCYIVILYRVPVLGLMAMFVMIILKLEVDHVGQGMYSLMCVYGPDWMTCNFGIAVYCRQWMVVEVQAIYETKRGKYSFRMCDLCEISGLRYYLPWNIVYQQHKENMTKKGATGKGKGANNGRRDQSVPRLGVAWSLGAAAPRFSCTHGASLTFC